MKIQTSFSLLSYESATQEQLYGNLTRATCFYQLPVIRFLDDLLWIILAMYDL